MNPPRIILPKGGILTSPALAPPSIFARCWSQQTQKAELVPFGQWRNNLYKYVDIETRPSGHFRPRFRHQHSASRYASQKYLSPTSNSLLHRLYKLKFEKALLPRSSGSLLLLLTSFPIELEALPLLNPACESCDATRV